MIQLDKLRMIDPVLTGLAQSYSNFNLIYKELFPIVAVTKQKGKIPLFGKEAFASRQTERAIRSRSNRILPSDIELITFETQEHDIEVALDYLENEESLNNLKYEKRLTKQLSDILELTKEIEAAELAQDTNEYSSGMYRELTNAEAIDNPSSTINPIELIMESKESIRSKIAIYPNTMIIGVRAYKALLNHTKIVEKIKFTGVQKVSKDMLSELFEIPNIKVGMALTSNDNTTFSDIWSDNIVLAYVDRSSSEERTEYNPSFGYTFQRQGLPETDTYFENGGKIKVIRCTDNYGIKITGKDAGYLIKNICQ
ncbi:MAG TPA: hypothetical protein PLE30_03000 [Candidatus Kapabacteria bacterium]|nr:hypothetical protein [Candidatus Kapabacteria bacterium]